MKKFLALLLTLVMALSLAACGGSDEESTGSPAEDPAALSGGVLYRLRIWFWMREPTVSANWSRERMRAKFRP